jgi:hypothetical protein
MRPNLTDVLLGDSEILGYVQAVDSDGLDRVFETEAPQDVSENADLAYIVWTADGQPASCMRGGIAGYEWIVEVSIYHKNQAAVASMADAVVRVLDSREVGATVTAVLTPERHLVTRQWCEYLSFTLWTDA